MVLNYIWIGFILIAFVVSFIKLVFFGDTEVFAKVMEAVFSMSKTSFEISIGLTGTLAFWMGLMKVGENGGAVRVLSKLVSPFFSRIFPEIPKNHPAMSAMMMNFSANMLGLDNAATPMGLQAMKEMQTLNPKKDTASNAMIMFLVLNTSGLTLIPITVMLYRAQLGAANPSDIFIPILLATAISTLAGLIITSIYQKINLLQPVVLAYLAGLIGLIAFTIYSFSQMESSEVQTVSSVVSNVILFGIIAFFVALAAFKRINVYDSFIEGAKGGFETAVKIIPYLVAILVAIGIFRASGALDMLLEAFKAFLAIFNIEGAFVEALPVAFMKPLSGSGARGVMIELMQAKGADSFVGTLASVMQGATDTTFYIIALYFGSVNIKYTRHAVSCGLLADFVGVFAAIVIAYIFFADRI